MHDEGEVCMGTGRLPISLSEAIKPTGGCWVCY